MDAPPPSAGPAARRVALAGLGLALAIALQALGLPNPVTGVAVNAVFVVLVGLAGKAPAVTVGLLTPLGAALTGHLPVLLLPLAPLIALGNAAFVHLYARGSRPPSAWRWVTGPGMKSAIIGGGGVILTRVADLPPALQAALLVIVAIQFGTALGGVALGEFLLARVTDHRPDDPTAGDVARR